MVVIGRVAWTVASLVTVEAVVCGLSAVPAVLLWQGVVAAAGSDPIARAVVFSVAIAPSYVLFAPCLMLVSPLASRLLRWHTPPDAEMRIAEMDWALMRWVRFGLGSVIEIGVEIGSNSQIGALSFVPKYTKLRGGVVYAGIPATPLP